MKLAACLSVFQC